jgi:hypothetical protein
MTDPAEFFPTEISELIFDYVTRFTQDSRSFANYCLVNQIWKSKFKPILYMTWTHDGEKHSLGSLWRFLCIVVRDASIAALVQTVDVQNLAFTNEDAPLVESQQEEVTLIQQAFRDAGIEIGDSMVRDLIKGDHQNSLVALLYTRLPNLHTLFAHFPHSNAFLNKVLQVASERQANGPKMKAFQKLEKLFLVPECEPEVVYDASLPDTRFLLDLDVYAGVFTLPKIQELLLFDLDAGWAQNDCYRRPRTSNIQHLTLVHHLDVEVIAAQSQAILAMPKILNMLDLLPK